MMKPSLKYRPNSGMTEQAVVLLTTLLLSLLAGCASTRPVGEGLPSGAERPVPQEMAFLDTLKAFHVEVLCQNHGLCPAPDGKNMPFLGRDASIQIVLTFFQEPPWRIKPDQLRARISHVEIPFSKRTSGKRFITDIMDLNALGPGMETGGIPVSLFYVGDGREVFLDTGGQLAIDTTPPLKPRGLQTSSSHGSSLLTWEHADTDVKEYRVQKWDSGQWLTIGSGFGSPPVLLDSGMNARIRVVAVDCALNRSFSQDLIVGDAAQLSITKIGCGKSRYMAYSGAQVLINDGFVREYVSPWLKSNTTFTNGEIKVLITERHQGWVPPGIQYTPQNRAKYYQEEGSWCAEVTGILNRDRFNEWVQERSQKLNR